MDITWELIGLLASTVSGTVAILVKLNHIENDYQAEKLKNKDIESQLLRTTKDLEIQHKEIARLKAQIGREFNNIAWQLRIIIGNQKDIETFLENRSGYIRRKSSEIDSEEDTRGFMLKKIKELDSPNDEDR
ncbi:hypothetical protein [Laspinema palackyanum]|uniref:hypothetical protein n=1 Tax=Laspinema palackyanum TaxID=3231601 RepID=UPI00345D641D|nr:hypothetical protein [Laspinema sp. D2c]